MRWTLATLFITLHMLGFPFAAFGCLLGGALLTLTNLQSPAVAKR
jgi:hypothetical protein